MCFQLAWQDFTVFISIKLFMVYELGSCKSLIMSHIRQLDKIIPVKWTQLYTLPILVIQVHSDDTVTCCIVVLRAALHLPIRLARCALPDPQHEQNSHYLTSRDVQPQCHSASVHACAPILQDTSERSRTATHSMCAELGNMSHG